MLQIGLTGGIGSGKSTVAKVFEQLGIPVYYADIEAKRIIEENPTVRQYIIQEFGEESYTNGYYNRSYISSVVFNQPDKLQVLNKIVHPFTILDAADWMKKQSAAYVIKEAALIFESGSNQGLNKIIGISSPIELRIKRVMERDGITEDEVLRKMKLQMPENEKLEKCDFIILNNEKEMMIPQILELHQSLLAISKSY